MNRTLVPLSAARVAVPALAVAVAGSLLWAAGASADIITPESGGSPNADRIDSLYKLILGMAIVVFVAVEGVLFWSMRKYKAKKGRVAAQIHGNTRLEVGWTVGAAIILIFITAVTFVQLNGIKNPARSDVDANGNPVASTGDGALYASTDQPPPPDRNALRIKVDGQQYLWRYQYPGPKKVFSYVDMIVPVGRTVILEISSDDVAHSWWIPELGGKMDAIPSYINKTWFKATKEDTFFGQCAELCGRNHANMLARVKAVSPQEYERFYNEKAAEIQRAQDEGARQRREIVEAEGADAAAGGSEGGAGGASAADQGN